MIEKLIDHEVNETVELISCDGKREIVFTGIAYLAKPDIREVIDKVNEIIEAMNKGESK